MDTRELAINCARIADALRAEDIVILDVRGLSLVTDYFVICSGDNRHQLRAIANRVRELAKANDVVTGGVEGYTEGQWVLMDFYDVVLHVFDKQLRSYYDLELLWGDAPEVEW